EKEERLRGLEISRGAWSIAWLRSIVSLASFLSPNRRRRDVFLGGFGFLGGVLRAFYGVVEIVFIKLRVGGIGGNFLQNDEEVFRPRSHQVDALADVLLFLNAQLNEIGGIVDATDVGVQQRIDHLHMLILGGVLQFVLQLLDAVIREREEQCNALVGRFGLADLVGLKGGKIVLLRLRCGASRRTAMKHS